MLESQKWYIQNLGFDRNILRTCRKKEEFDINGAHPRFILRDIRRYLEGIKSTDGNYIFDVKKDPVEIVREDVGKSLGVVRGGLEAKHEHYEHDIGNLTFFPFKLLSINLFIIGGLLLLIPLLIDKYGYSILALPLLYLGNIYRTVEAKSTFPMKVSDDVYCSIEGEMNEDEKQKVDSNISVIISGVNYTGFWDKTDYLDYFQDNFELDNNKIISNSIDSKLFSIGNVLSKSNYPNLIADQIDENEKLIYEKIYENNKEIIKKNSKNTKLLGKKELKEMNAYQIKQELQKTLESNYELGKYLNKIVLNQEVNEMIKQNNKTFSEPSQTEADINTIINDLFTKLN